MWLGCVVHISYSLHTKRHAQKRVLQIISRYHVMEKGYFLPRYNGTSPEPGHYYVTMYLVVCSKHFFCQMFSPHILQLHYHVNQPECRMLGARIQCVAQSYCCSQNERQSRNVQSHTWRWEEECPPMTVSWQWKHNGMRSGGWWELETGGGSTCTGDVCQHQLKNWHRSKETYGWLGGLREYTFPYIS